MQKPSFSQKSLFQIGIGLSLALGLILVKMSFHEMWKDEWQAWFLSRDLSVGGLLSFLYYEGHPSLWYLYLKPFTLMDPSGLLGLPLAHTCAFLATYYLLFRLKGTFWIKVLIALSYALAFEYGVVNRGYILVVLISLAIIYFYQKRDFNNWKVFVLLFLLCQTEFQGVFLAFSFLLYNLWENREKWRDTFHAWLSGAIGLIVFVITVYPRKDQDELSNAYSEGWFNWQNWAANFQGTTSNALWPGVFPDTNVFGTNIWGILTGALLLMAIGFLLRKQKALLVFFFSFWLTIWLFHSMIYSGGLRQWSMISVALGLTLMLKPIQWSHKIGATLIFALFIPSVLYTLKAVKRDIQVPFTNAMEAGEFLESKVPSNVPIVGINKFECTPVAGYYGQPIYSLPEGEPFTFFKWVEKVYLPSEDELKLFAKFKGVGGLVIVSPYELPTERYPTAKEWQRFTEFNLKNENYYIYLLDR